MEWTNDSLDFGEYIGDSTPKNMVFLHHTAGSHRPDWTIHGWNTDGTSTNKSRVATSWVIGGKSTRDGNDDFDGKVYRAFDEEYWAYHLGTRSSDTNGINLNKNIIIISMVYLFSSLSEKIRFYTFFYAIYRAPGKENPMPTNTK